MIGSGQGHIQLFKKKYREKRTNPELPKSRSTAYDWKSPYSSFRNTAGKDETNPELNLD